MPAVRSLAVMIGASLKDVDEWASFCARKGLDLVAASPDRGIAAKAADKFRDFPVSIEILETDLSRPRDAQRLFEIVGDRHVTTALVAPPRETSVDFIEGTFDFWRRSIGTEILGTLFIVQKLARRMAADKEGALLFSGLTRFTPQAGSVDLGIKGFMGAFAAALRNELKNAGVVVVVLLDGENGAQYLNCESSPCGLENGKKEAASDPAISTFVDMMKTGGEFMEGWQKMVQSAMASFVPSGKKQE